MQTKSIVFTAPKTAEVLMQETKPVTEDLVAVRMEYTVVSGGTERAAASSPSSLATAVWVM